MRSHQFKLFRWLKGGKWAQIDGVWWPVGDGGWISRPVITSMNLLSFAYCHFTNNRVTKLEDYIKCQA